MPDAEKQEYFKIQLPKSHRSVKKTHLVEMYYEILQDIDEQLVQESVSGDITESLDANNGDISCAD